LVLTYELWEEPESELLASLEAEALASLEAEALASSEEEALASLEAEALASLEAEAEALPSELADALLRSHWREPMPESPLSPVPSSPSNNSSGSNSSSSPSGNSNNAWGVPRFWLPSTTPLSLDSLLLAARPTGELSSPIPDTTPLLGADASEEEPAAEAELDEDEARLEIHWKSFWGVPRFAFPLLTPEPPPVEPCSELVRLPSVLPVPIPAPSVPEAAS